MTATPRTRLAAGIAAAAAAVLALTACSSGTDAPAADGELTTLKVATIGLVSDGALLLGDEQGFFEEEGLRIETSVVANPPAGLAAAQSGQVDIAYAPSIPLLNALASGVPLTVVAPADGYVEGASELDDPASVDDTGLYASADSGITEVAELEGATIAVPARKAQLEVVIADSLQRAGVATESVNWVVLDFTSAVAALANGTVDAAGLVSPFTAEAEAGGSTFIDAPSVGFFEEGAVGLWTAGENTVSGKADAIAAFQRAVAKSNAYANENPDEAIQAGIDYTSSTLAVDQIKLPFWPAEVAPIDLERVNEKLVALGFLPEPVDLEGVIVSAE
ncbi:ABC transporter substrate-binding protein [Microbacterium istanbulense]|uniref:ABC transporter substrate-binding protein n=1 Tax=Microbacterium istanbulense TaxID=3122049 RepID=A0ABU8LHV3_9MICO